MMNEQYVMVSCLHVMCSTDGHEKSDGRCKTAAEPLTLTYTDMPQAAAEALKDLETDVNSYLAALAEVLIRIQFTCRNRCQRGCADLSYSKRAASNRGADWKCSMCPSGEAAAEHSDCCS